MRIATYCLQVTAFLLLILLGACTPSENSQILPTDAMVTTPDTAGLTETEARQAIIDAGLSVGTVTSQPSDDVAIGDVVRTEPGAGISITEGSSVSIVLSSGSAEVSVPTTAGATQTDAQAALIDAGLVLGGVTLEVSNNVPAGQVIRSTPAAGSTVPRDSNVVLIISTGPADVSVPNVLNLEEAIAVLDLEAAGLVAGDITGAPDMNVPFGRVIEQSPVAGVMVSANTPVDIVVSLGPENIMVPDVTGLSEGAAGIVVLGANLSVGEITVQPNVDTPAGDVISQNPPAGTLVAQTTPVDLLVSLGPDPVPMPNIVGLTEAQAVTVVTNSGAAVGVITRRFDNNIPQDQVISQATPAGTIVALGTLLDFVVSLGQQIAVPNVVGLVQADAETAITDAMLIVGDITEQNDFNVPAGNVISQNPNGGTLVAGGTAIDLVVSLGPPTVAVPNLVGQTEAQAGVLLNNAALVLGTVTQQASATVATGIVISQDPVEATVVIEGSAVNIVVSSGP